MRKSSVPNKIYRQNKIKKLSKKHFYTVLSFYMDSWTLGTPQKKIPI